MSIKYFTEDVQPPKIGRREASNWIKNVIASEGFSLGDVSFIFCSDDYLLDVNRNFLDHDYYTDIITFDYVEGKIISGDIFISLDRVKDNSAEFKTSLENEIHRILIHGILHLLGYKDKSKKDKLIMTEKENLCLKVLNDSRLQLK
ncbi:MAG: rRNA maturation RNase YbeY [Prolixibacteraceae bacterium]